MVSELFLSKPETLDSANRGKGGGGEDGKNVDEKNESRVGGQASGQDAEYIVEEGGAAGGGGAGGGGGGDGEGGSEGGTEKGEEGKEFEYSCMLVRPGNIPNMSCSVNYITKDDVSLRLKNDYDNEIGVVIRLNRCSEESGEIGSNSEKDFVFSCEESEGVFNEAVFISYIIGENKRVDVGGFVSGKISR